MGGYYYEKEYETMLRKFGFTEADKKKPLREFSGGQQTKLGFIKMLLSKPIFFFWTSRLTTLISRQLNGLRII